jgi:hypothetical protein
MMVCLRFLRTSGGVGQAHQKHKANKAALANPLPPPRRSRTVMRSHNLNRRLPPGSGWQASIVRHIIHMPIEFTDNCRATAPCSQLTRCKQILASICGIFPGPLLFRHSGIDIITEPHIPHAIIILCYCVGATAIARLVIDRVTELFMKQR